MQLIQSRLSLLSRLNEFVQLAYCKRSRLIQHLGDLFDPGSSHLNASSTFRSSRKAW